MQLSTLGFNVCLSSATRFWGSPKLRGASRERGLMTFAQTVPSKKLFDLNGLRRRCLRGFRNTRELPDENEGQKHGTCSRTHLGTPTQSYGVRITDPPPPF